MTKELREKLAALRAIAPALNKATDEATAIVEKVEHLLGQELNIGIRATSNAFECEDSIEIDDDDDRTEWDIRKASMLAYGRVAGTYRIHVVTDVSRKDRSFYRGDYETISSEQTPWNSCPRETKL